MQFPQPERVIDLDERGPRARSEVGAERREEASIFALRAEALARPFDPRPLAALGMRALETLALGEAETSFRDALRLAPEHRPSHAGLALLHWVWTGGVAGLDGVTLDDLGGRIRERLVAFTDEARQIALPGCVDPEPTPADVRAIAVRDLGRSARLAILAGQPPAVPPGRRATFDRLAALVTTEHPRPVLLAVGEDVDHASVLERILLSIGVLGAGPRLFEIDGGISAPCASSGERTTITPDQLGRLARRGYRFVHRDLAAALRGDGAAGVLAAAGVDGVVSVVSHRLLDRLFEATPALRPIVDIVELEGLSATTTTRLLARDRAALDAAVGAPVPPRIMKTAITLAARCLPRVALPESAVHLLAQATAYGRTTPSLATVRAAAASTAGLPARSPVVTGRVDEARLAKALMRAAPALSAEGIHAVYSVVAACAADRSVSTSRPGPVVLVISGAGSATRESLASAVAEHVFGDGAVLAVDLGVDGERAFGPAAAGNGGGGEPSPVAAFLRRRPHGLVFFDRPDRAAPPALAALARLLALGRTPQHGADPSAERKPLARVGEDTSDDTSIAHTLIAIGVVDEHGGRDVGFVAGATRRERARAGALHALARLLAPTSADAARRIERAVIVALPTINEVD